MATNIEDYVASGYFLSRWIGPHDCTGIELRRISLASEHSPRKFFPDAWALWWCHGSHEERVEEARVFGIEESDLPRVTAWADASFDVAFGAWSVFFELGAAQSVACSLLGNATDLELWGVGLHRSLVSAYCEASQPLPAMAGYAPTGANGVHIATCKHANPLADGGEILGHELLIDDIGCAFSSPESRHLDEQELFRAVGVVPNKHGLIDSYDEALVCCRHLEAHSAETPHKITGWCPWLLVRYPIGR